MQAQLLYCFCSGLKISGRGGLIVFKASGDKRISLGIDLNLGLSKVGGTLSAVAL